MEALYAKLYNKYSKLKKEKESPLDKLHREQELKFLNYAAAADEMIEYLKSENDKLQEQVNELKSELASTRSSSNEQLIHYQKLLTEENQKNRELSEEISKYQKLEQEECSTHAMNEEDRSELQNSDQNSPARRMPSKSVLKSAAKKRKNMLITEGTTTHIDGELEHQMDKHFIVNKDSGTPLSIHQPACQRMINSSGCDSTQVNYSCCLFQCLVESLVGMKVSALSQSKEPCIMACHQSSGYSFSLTWITRSQGDAELLYRMLSLGTFEKVAPEWMREMLMFSTSMCSIFFERISRIIKL